MKGSLLCKNYQNMRLKTEVSRVAALRVSQGEFCPGQGGSPGMKKGLASDPMAKVSDPLRERARIAQPQAFFTQVLVSITGRVRPSPGSGAHVVNGAWPHTRKVLFFLGRGW